MINHVYFPLRLFSAVEDHSPPAHGGFASQRWRLAGPDIGGSRVLGSLGSQAQGAEINLMEQAMWSGRSCHWWHGIHHGIP